MPKKKRNHNPNLIREKHAYTLAEIAEVYEIHIGTAQSWHKQGLQAIDETSRPLYFIGFEIRRFLRAKAQKRKYKLMADEFFCPKCKGPRKSGPDKLSVEITNKRLGKIAKQTNIKGVCDVCGQNLLRFSSDLQVRKLQETWPMLSEHLKGLYGIDDSSINIVLRKGGNDENQY